MKRTKTSSLLTGVAAVAGLAMGASIAMAAHPEIQLFTYEEVAEQMGMPGGAPVMVDSTYKKGMPYSPKATCSGGNVQSGACHSDNTTATNSKGKPVVGYSALAKHAYHSALGYNEWMDNSETGLFVEGGIQTGLNPQKPWLQSHGHNGKW